MLALLASCATPKGHDAKPDATAPAPVSTPSAAPTVAIEELRPPDATATRAAPARSPAPARGLPESLERITRDPFAPDLRKSGAIAIGTISVSGGLMPDPKHAVSRMKSGFRACLAGGEGGRLTLDVLVAENGSVVSAKATDVVDLEPAVVDCIERRARAATFPPPAGGQAHVIIPLASEPAAGGT